MTKQIKLLNLALQALKYKHDFPCVFFTHENGFKLQTPVGIYQFGSLRQLETGIINLMEQLDWEDE